MWSLILLAVAILPTTVLSKVPSYDNAFVNATYLFQKQFPKNTASAQKSIIAYADEIATEGPWSVMDKAVTPPNGDKHTYMSWAPYWWPDCSSVNNRDSLSKEQIWKTCPYKVKDGQFNPDRTLVNDTLTVNKMADAVLYNSIAWALDGSKKYETNTVNFIKTWFLDEETYMKPNLDYGQMHRGPTGQKGTQTGILDLHGMSKVVSGILILREGKSTAWTSDLDSQMNNWTTSYLNWLETAKIAVAEKDATNNHGSYYYNQAISLKILVGDMDGAKQAAEDYFTGVFQNQIDADGEQPLEATRTRPYHYRSYALSAMVTNAQLAEYVGYDGWGKTTKKGGTIQKAADFEMKVNPGSEPQSGGFPNIAAVGSVYGDTKGNYAAWLKSKSSTYSQEPWFLWFQPLSA